MAEGCSYAEVWLDPDSQIDLYARIEGQVVQVRVSVRDPQFVVGIGSLPQMMTICIDTNRDNHPETGLSIYRNPDTQRIETEINQDSDDVDPEGDTDATPETQAETTTETEGPSSPEPGEEYPADEDLQS